MKKNLAVSLMVVLFWLTLQINFTSCTKTNTVTIKDTTITTAILTASSWKAEEIRGILGNTPVYYLRGGSNNTIDLDSEYVAFSANGTGTYTNNSGTQTSLTWNFTDATNTSIVWTWNLPTPVVVTWENMFYKNGAIHYTEYYTQSGQNELTAGIRIPK